VSLIKKICTAGNARNEGMKYRCGLGADMMETGLIACACIVSIFLGFYQMAKFIRHQLHIAVEELDQRVASALTSVIQELPLGEIEPPNLIQQFLVQMMQDQLPKQTVEVIPRDEKGLFASRDNL
tara:strand:+ start:38 stop:412 length:375 start_codon:yes stop_codon:yes gene_type:complete